MLSGIRNRRRLLWDWRVAIHESAHLVAAKNAGKFCRFASIVPRLPDRELGITGYLGVAVHTHDQNDSGPIKIPDKIRDDIKQAAGLCWLTTAPDLSWRAALGVYRRLRRETEQLVIDHWQAIESLARALIERKSLTQGEIEEILEHSECRTAMGAGD
jgi:hypothetical protein